LRFYEQQEDAEDVVHQNRTWRVALPLVLQPAFAQQSVDAARAKQQGVAATNASPPTNTPPPTRTGDGQVMNSNPTSGGGEGSGGGKK